MATLKIMQRFSSGIRLTGNIKKVLGATGTDIELCNVDSIFRFCLELAICVDG